MKFMRVLGFIVLAGLLNFCSNGQSSNFKLSATEFDTKLKQLTGAPILDVRSPQEFSQSHIANAINVDWNGKDFDKKIATLDKAKPVFVYCLSGARSASAASRMRSIGFREVYELNGGLLKWRSLNLPELSVNNVNPAGMSREDFSKLIVADKIVLVDFYADWCGPCQKMEPYLKEISMDMADKVVVVRINADDNRALCKELKIDALPVLLLYKNKTLSWTNTGYIDKAGVLQQLGI